MRDARKVWYAARPHCVTMKPGKGNIFWKNLLHSVADMVVATATDILFSFSSFSSSSQALGPAPAARAFPTLSPNPRRPLSRSSNLAYLRARKLPASSLRDGVLAD
jgi:hypothetical protein